jgi:hypothetical protein
MNLQIDQFRFKDRRNKLTKRAVQFKAYANAVKDEFTYRSVHELQITGVEMNLLTDQFT